MTTILGNGYIEGRELDHFLREFVASVSINDLGADVSTTSNISRSTKSLSAKEYGVFLVLFFFLEKEKMLLLLLNLQ